MENARLVSHESAFSTNSDGQHSRFKKSVSLLAKSLQDQQHRRLSQQTQTSASSGWSRALIPWYPKTRRSSDGSRNSTSTIFAYPARYPMRLQLVMQAPISIPATTLKEQFPEVTLEDLNAGRSEHQPLKSDVVTEQLFPSTTYEQSLMCVERNVRIYARELDDQFPVIINKVSLIGHGIVAAEMLERDGKLQDRKGRITTIFTTLKTTLGTSQAVLIASYLFCRTASNQYQELVHQIYQYLCSPNIQRDYANDILCLSAKALREQPGRSVDLADGLQKCLIKQLAMCLPSTSPALLFVKNRYCTFLIDSERTGTAQNTTQSSVRVIWEELDTGNIKSITDKHVRNWLLEDLAAIACYLKDYASAKHYTTLILNATDQDQLPREAKARHLNRLMKCNFELGYLEAALEQAKMSLSLNIEDDVIFVDRRKRLRGMILEIQAALLKERQEGSAGKI